MGDRKILVADYNTRDLQQMKKLFGDAGYEVITAQDGKAALDLFAQEQPDVVLLSAMLSKVNGFDVCRQIKESDSGKGTAVIIATSVYKGQKYRVKAIHENKASEFVEKPIPDEQLLEIVRRYAGETQALISSKRDSIREKQREIAEEVSEESTIDSMLDASLKPSTARPVSPPAAAPEPVKAPPPAAKVQPRPAAAEPEPRMLDVEKLLKDEIASTVLAQEVKSAPVDSDESLDRLLSDTLSGLGISLDTKDKAPKPAPTPAAAPAPATAAVPAAAKAVAPPMPDTGQLKIKQIEEDILRDKEAEDSAKAVEKLMMSFDTDLERKLSDTLSGVGLSDTSIGKVIESPRPEPEEEEIVEEGQKFGEYVLIEKIGHGGMAELFKAKKRGHEGFQKIVAIKRILPHLSDNKELVTMFIDEAKIAAQLTHQNIANIFDFGKIDNSYYIAMEHVEGFDLKKVLSKAKEIKIRVPHKIAAYIALQIASALDYAHHKKDFNNKEMNIVHRDVSPQNILISREGEVKLVDFGISKAESKIHHTVKGALKGKLLYMSPEQAWGKNVNKSSDIYSLGIVLCEMVSGKVLFEDSSEFDVLEKVRSGKIPLLDNELNNLPPRLKQIVDKALMIDSAKRYQNAASMIKDLHDYLHAGGAVPTPKDLAQILIRVFPNFFGLKEADVQHLSFDEFQEGVEGAPPKPPSEETVLLGKDEMAGLEAMPVESRPLAAQPLAANEEIIVSSQAKPAEKPSSAPTAPYLTPAAAAPPKPKETPAPLKPAADQRKPLEIKKPAEVKKAPEPVKPPPKKAPELKKPVEVKKAPEPVKAPEPKAVPAAPAAPKAPSAPKPADDKSPTKLLKDQKRASQAPAFTAAAPSAKPFPKGILIGAAAGVVIIILLIVLFMGGGKKEPEPAPGTRPDQAGASEAASETGTSSGEPTPGETGETSSPSKPGATQPVPGAENRPDSKTPPPGTPQPPQPARPDVQPAAIGVIPGAQGTGSVSLPTSGLPFLPTQPAPTAPAPVPAAPAPPPATAPRPAATPAVQPRSDFQLGLPTTQDQVKTGDLVALTSDVKPPKPVAQPSPSNPSDAAKRINIRGKVTVTCGLLVSHTGAVEKVVIRSVNPPNAGPIYSGPVQSALSKWRYTPAEKSGVKVKVWTNVTLAFEVR